jgi:hypothetical protein
MTPTERSLLNSIEAMAGLLTTALPGCSARFRRDATMWWINARFAQHDPALSADARKALAEVMDEFKHRLVETKQANREDR